MSDFYICFLEGWLFDFCHIGHIENLQNLLKLTRNRGGGQANLSPYFKLPYINHQNEDNMAKHEKGAGFGNLSPHFSADAHTLRCKFTTFSAKNK